MNPHKIRTLSAAEADIELVRLLDSGVTLPLMVTGSSMLPFLRDKRDTVWLVKADRLHRGQILFFRRQDGSMVLHRIRRIWPDGRMLVNGDAQVWCEIVHPEQAVAVVCAVTKNEKKQLTNAIGMKIRDAIWYPTRPFRPLIFKMYGFFRRIFF